MHPQSPQTPKPEDKDKKRKQLFELREKCFDELNIVCSIVGRKEDIDRVDLAQLLKAYEDVSYLELS